MAIATYSSMRAKMASPYFRAFLNKAPAANGFLQSTWVSNANPILGVAPTTAAAPTNAAVGAVGQPDSTTSVLRALGFNRYQAGGPSALVLFDRLSHQGGLSGTVTTEQTTNFDTAALTRYTTGAGVILAAEIYTAVGTTGTTISARYTNQAGTASRNTPGRTFGGTNFREGSQILPLPFQAGDSGVRSVQGVTVLASTGTAGAFGVTLFKPLMSFVVMATLNISQAKNFVLDFCQSAPEVLDGACLGFMLCNRDTTFAQFVGSMVFAED